MNPIPLPNTQAQPHRPPLELEPGKAVVRPVSAAAPSSARGVPASPPTPHHESLNRVHPADDPASAPNFDESDSAAELRSSATWPNPLGLALLAATSPGFDAKLLQRSVRPTTPYRRPPAGQNRTGTHYPDVFWADTLLGPTAVDRSVSAQNVVVKRPNSV